MSDFAVVTVRVEDLIDIEQSGYAHSRRGEHDQALKMWALALKIRQQSGFTSAEVVEVDDIFPRVPSNVVEMSDYLGVSGRSA